MLLFFKNIQNGLAPLFQILALSASLFWGFVLKEKLKTSDLCREMKTKKKTWGWHNDRKTAQGGFQFPKISLP